MRCLPSSTAAPRLLQQLRGRHRAPQLESFYTVTHFRWAEQGAKHETREAQRGEAQSVNHFFLKNNSTLKCPRHQILANNSTTLGYSKITWYWAINWGWILGLFGGYNSTWVIFESELKKLACFRAISNRAGIRASPNHDFWFSLPSFDLAEVSDF